MVRKNIWTPTLEGRVGPEQKASEVPGLESAMRAVSVQNRDHWAQFQLHPPQGVPGQGRARAGSEAACTDDRNHLMGSLPSS